MPFNPPYLRCVGVAKKKRLAVDHEGSAPAPKSNVDEREEEEEKEPRLQKMREVLDESYIIRLRTLMLRPPILPV